MFQTTNQICLLVSFNAGSCKTCPTGRIIPMTANGVALVDWVRTVGTYNHLVICNILLMEEILHHLGWLKPYK